MLTIGSMKKNAQNFREIIQYLYNEDVKMSWDLRNSNTNKITRHLLISFLHVISVSILCVNNSWNDSHKKYLRIKKESLLQITRYSHMAPLRKAVQIHQV